MDLDPANATEPLAALIIGAGPAGLATAVCLKRRGIDALVLEAAPSIAHAWRNYYDRLHLHTVKQQSQLPGLPFGKELPRYPSRADFLSYLESYAARFEIAEIALDLAERGAKPTLAVRAPVNIVPRDFLGMPTQLTSIRLRKLPLALGDRIGRMVGRLAFGNLARYGFARPELGPLSAIKLRRRIPLIDVGTIAAIKRGEIAVKPGVQRLTETGAVFADDSADDFDAVVLATGFRPALDELLAIPDVLDDQGYPRDWRGGGAHPGLFFVGYELAPTGHLREIALRAEAVAAEIARA